MGSMLVVLATAALAAPSGVTIPFTWTPGQIEVAVEVNGTAATFLLDTGSEYSIVSSRLAQALRLATGRRGARDFTDAVRLTLKGIALEQQPVMVMPFDTYYQRGRSIDGLLGYDLFERYAVRIDFSAKALTLWPASDFRPPQAAVDVPITFAGRLPVVAARLHVTTERTLDARLMIDTGASQAVLLRYPFATRHQLIDPAAARTTAPSLADGTRTLIDVPVEQVSVGSLSFDRPGVRAFAEPVGSAAGTDTDGVIGNTLLSRFTVYVDYARKRLLFEPRRR
jgi:aspartyl protease